MIKAVIFDYGGVIGTNVMPNVYSETAKLAGTNYDEVRKGFHMFVDVILKGDMSIAEFWERYAKVLKVDAKALESTWNNTYTSHSKKNEGVVKIAEDLKKEGYKIVLLSNAIETWGDHRKRQSLGIFEVIVFSHEVGMRKPDRDIYEFTLGKLGLQPEECIFIDDKLENVRAAEKLGVKGIIFENVGQLRKGLEKHGVKI